MDEPNRTLNRRLLEAMDRFGAATCFRVWRNERYRDISYRHFRRQTLRLTRELRGRRLVGERAVILASNSPEWLVVHMAVSFAGGLAVPLRRSLPPDAVLDILDDCTPKVVVVQDHEQVRWLDQQRDRLPWLDLVLTLDDLPPDLETDPADRSEGWTVLALSSAVAERLDGDALDTVRRAVLAVSPDALAAIRYTTTQSGSPLGAVFDQGQRFQALEHLDEWFHLDDDDVAFTTLSWGYVPSLEAAFHYFVCGVPNVLSQNRDLVFEEIQQASPTLILTIPNALERAYEMIAETGIQTLPESTQEMFYWAVATAKKMQAAGTDASSELRERFARADRTFFSAIRGAFGGRFRRFVCTGAPLEKDLAESIQAIGLPPINVYSLTESGGFPAVHPGDGRQVESCGPAAPGFELRVADDGEIQVRGATVMLEYWQNPEATRVVFTDDGWLRTRDYGELAEDGHLRLTGRVGETLLLSTGRRVDPCYVERLLEESPWIHRAVAFGEGRPYVAVLIIPDTEALGEHLRSEQELADDEEPQLHRPLSASAAGLSWVWGSLGDGEARWTVADPRVAARLDEAVAVVNQQLDDWGRIERFSLLGGPQSIESERLAEARMHDRAQLLQLFGDEVQAMYPRGVRSTDREITQVQVGPERLRELLEKEAILDAWTSDAGVGFLLELAREHRIDAPSVIHICDAAANVAQMESEEKPLSTALIVGDPLRIHRVVPTSLIQLHRHEHIRRMRSRLVDLSKLVDGLVLAYIVDRHGYVRGIGRLDSVLEEAPKALFGPQFRRHAEISRRCDAVVFFVPKGGRQVRVFSRGQLVGRYTNGDWSPENASLLAGTVGELTAGRDADPELVARLLRCAFRMSEKNLGAIFMLGDAERILAKSDRPEISRFAWISSAPMSALTDDELINFAQQDGATVIDAESGRFRSCMVLLRPDAGTRADIGEGKGARHSSAAKMSAETQSLAITVSQDGPITVFDQGQRILSI